jgi:hypothetical protein
MKQTARCLWSLLLLGAVMTAQAVTIDLDVVDSFAFSSPFGLAYDNVHNTLWVTGLGAGTSTEYSVTNLTATGNTTPLGGAALGFANGQLYVARYPNVVSADPYTGANSTNHPITAPVMGILSLIDGFDVQGSEFWYSPDVGNVYRLTAAGAFLGPNPFLGGAGGYSGVERVDISTNTFIIVVNDASNPRRLCVHDLSATEIGCTTLPNNRYEDLAFDGRYLYAADLFGQRVDQIDVKVNGGSIFEPPDGVVPEPGTFGLMSASLLGFVAVARRYRKA